MSFCLSEWGCVLDGAHNQRETLLTLIENKLQEKELPGVDWAMVSRRTREKWLGFVAVEQREFLEVYMDGADGYTIDACIEAFGKTLAVHVALCGDVSPKELEEEISWEEETVLEDWGTVVFRCVRQACEELSEQLDSPARLKAETHGILSIW